LHKGFKKVSKKNSTICESAARLSTRHSEDGIVKDTIRSVGAIQSKDLFIKGCNSNRENSRSGPPN
jgi:hypothetical protein